MTSAPPDQFPHDVVLVVDDEEGIRETLVEILRMHGIRAVGAASGAEALERNAEVHAAVVDDGHGLPDMTGLALGGMLKAGDRDLQVIMLTGYPTIEGAIAAVREADDFMTKPVNQDELVRVVRSSIVKRQLRRKNIELVNRLLESNAELEASIAERNRDLDGLAAMAVAIASAATRTDVLEAVARTAAHAATASAAGVYLMDGPSSRIRLVAEWPRRRGLPTTITRPDRVLAPVSLPSLGMAAMQAELSAGGEYVGALLLAEPERTSSTFLRTVALEASVAIQNAQRLDLERETVEQLSELSRLKSAFLATVSHELRTPVTAMTGFAELLAADDDTLSAADRSHIAARMSQQGSRLHRLINDLLDSTALETGTLRVSMEPVDPGPLIEHTVASIPPGGPPITVDVEAGLPKVQCDPGRLEQVLVNLIVNAAKHTTDGSPVVVGAASSEGAVDLWVADQGSGMDPSFIPRAFEPFTQAEPLGGRYQQGMGLGLYIVRGLVEAMGGTIEVTTGPGRGTRFSFRLAPAG